MEVVYAFIMLTVHSDRFKSLFGLSFAFVDYIKCRQLKVYNCTVKLISATSSVCHVQVNNVDFANIIREEAVLFLLDLPRGEEVTILAQKKKDGE